MEKIFSKQQEYQSSNLRDAWSIRPFLGDWQFEAEPGGWWIKYHPASNKKHSTCNQTLSDPLSNSNYRPSVVSFLRKWNLKKWSDFLDEQNAEKKGLRHLKPTFSRKISRVVKLCFFQVANKKPKTFSFCTLKQKVSWFQCGSSEDRWMPFIVDSVKRDLTSVATRQGHLWNLYWWLPNPGKWVEAQWGTSSWLIFYLFFVANYGGVKT